MAEPSPAESLTRYLLLLALAAVFYLLRYVFFLQGQEAEFAQDFAVFHRAAQWLVDKQSTLYHAEDIRLFLQGRPQQFGTHPFLYPPFFLFYVAPIAWLSHVPALLAWYALQLVLLVAVLQMPSLRAQLPQLATLSRQRFTAMALALFSPFLVVAMGAGQTGILSAALLLAGLSLLGARPFAAGLVFSLMAFKPQTLLLLPVALLAGRHFHALAGMAVGGALLTVSSALVFGLAPWADYMATLPIYSQLVQSLPEGFKNLVLTPYMQLRVWGVGHALALGAQLAISLGLALLLWRGWRSDAAMKTPLLCAALCLASPYLLLYDAILLAVGLLFLMEKFAANQLSAPMRLLFLACAFLPLVAAQLNALYVPYASLATAALFLASARRKGLPEA